MGRTNRDSKAPLVLPNVVLDAQAIVLLSQPAPLPYPRANTHTGDKKTKEEEEEKRCIYMDSYARGVDT